MGIRGCTAWCQVNVRYNRINEVWRVSAEKRVVSCGIYAMNDQMWLG